MDVAARHHLAVVAGPGLGWVLPLTGGAAVVGRGAEADLSLPDPRMSRAHLRVRDRGGRVRVADLGSANGTRVLPARGTPTTGTVPRVARLARRVGRRWRPLPVGSRVLAGDTVLELRVHPGMVLPVDAEETSDLTGGLLGRLMLPLLMSVSALPLLLGGGGGRWRLVLLIALPAVLVVAICWPALRDRARRLRKTAPQEDTGPPVPQPVTDPAALLAAAGAPVLLPESGPRWEVGTANLRSAVPRAPGRRLRGRAGRRAEQMRFLAMPEPGSAMALVGPPDPVEALARWLAVRHHAITGEGVSAPWPELAGLAPSEPAADARRSLDAGRSLGAGRSTPWRTDPGPTTREETAGTALQVRLATPRGAAAHAERDTPPDQSTRGLLLAEAMNAVPRWCASVLEVRPGHDRQVTAEWASAVVAELASRVDGVASVPTSVHLGELLEPPGTPPPGWAEPGVRAPLGRGPRGAVWLDLAESGPHALVAGTTGSGKSELLLAWILALAHQAAPADTSFVLFDYKGGATFTPLRDLAHVAGVLTDLDEAATARALASLQAELRARERALAAVGAHDLDEQRRRTSGAQRLGRLLVVVDEFRVMADTHPEQLDALVRLAAQGRSLGIHLVLATQRPGGAITPDMRANLTVRVCLRVLEETDSLDMLGDASAARLPRLSGRAVLRTERAEVLQTAWCGEVAEGWVAGRVTALNEAAERLAEAEPWRRSLRRPWAPPLPQVCRVADLERYGDPARPEASPAAGTLASAERATPSEWAHSEQPSSEWASSERPSSERARTLDGSPRMSSPPAYPVPWALLDLPDEQRLATRVFPGGALLVAGGPGSGRSTALQTITESALRGGTTVHVVAEDAEKWPGRDAPAAGTWCSTADPRRVRRLVELLLAGAGPGLLVLDEVDAVAESLDETGAPGQGTDLLLTVLRRARRLGLDILMSTAASTRRWAAAADRQLLLSPRDPADAVLAGAPRELVGTGWPPGRGVLLDRGEAWLTQVALVDPDPAQWTPAEGSPLRLAALPEVVHLAQATRAGDPASPEGASPGRVVLGRGGDEAGWLSRALAPGGTWLVCGPPGSGRSTALHTVTHQLSEQGWQVLDGRPASAGPELTGRELTGTELTGTEWTGTEWTGPELAGPEPGSTGADSTGPDSPASRRTVLVVDDADRLPSSAAERWAGYLAANPKTALLAAARAESLATAFHPLAARLREPNLSLVLADPRPAHLPGVDLRAVQDPVTRPGRGVLVDAAGALPLQVALAAADRRPGHMAAVP